MCVVAFGFLSVNLPDYSGALYASPEMGMLLGSIFLAGVIVLLVLDILKKKKADDKKESPVLKVLLLVFAILGIGLAGVFGIYNLYCQFSYHYEQYFFIYNANTEYYETSNGLSEALVAIYSVLSLPGWVATIMLIIKKFKKAK